MMKWLSCPKISNKLNNEQKGNNSSPCGPRWRPMYDVWRERFREGGIYEKRKIHEIMKSQKIRIILYFYFC